MAAGCYTAVPRVQAKNKKWCIQNKRKKKTKTTLLSVIKEKLMVDLSFSLA